MRLSTALMGNTAENHHRYVPGEVVAGRYLLERELGEGGMGVVWVAKSLALDISVALKMLRAELAGTEAVERMAREARTAAQLGHPAMVRVLDFGKTERDEPFLVMELLEGEELHKILERERRISPVRAVGLLLPVIEGLAMAHEKGIVHRDIKPENIFIARDDRGRLQPKVLDFGIAKRGSGGPIVTRLTQTGMVLGSPQYFSPEQAVGVDEVDYRSDIWAVGVVLYELVTGTLPFEGKNYNALIYSISRSEPTPITAVGVGDQQLWAIIARCLTKDPSHRWNTLREFGESLALWLFDKGVQTDASSRSLKDAWLNRRMVSLAPPASGKPDGGETIPPSKGGPGLRRNRPAAGLVSTIRRPAADSPLWRRALPFATLLGIAALAGIVLGLRKGGGDEPIAASAVAASAVAPKPVLPPAPLPQAPPPAPAAVASVPAVEEAAPEPSAAASAPRKEPAPARRKPRAPRIRSGVDTEFGF